MSDIWKWIAGLGWGALVLGIVHYAITRWWERPRLRVLIREEESLFRLPGVEPLLVFEVINSGGRPALLRAMIRFRYRNPRLRSIW